MDIDVKTSLFRTFDTVGDKWEKMGTEFFENIVIGYEKCEKLDIMKNRWMRIDAKGNEEEVFDRIIEKLKITLI
jgi:thymidylate kinase